MFWMVEFSTSIFSNRARSDWIRLRTLTLLRWMAVAGQLGAVIVAEQVLGLDLYLGFCVVLIGFSAALNVVTWLVAPANTRLSERHAALLLIYDILQLGALLFLTGGISNPFSVLILAPVTISATALTLRATMVVGWFAFLIITLLARWNLPLRNFAGEEILAPPLFIFGSWAALAISILFLSVYARRVTVETFNMSQALAATQLALGREQRLTALGGVVAAAAHELGTPLATIKLVSTELKDELADRPELQEDAALIAEQTDRCRDILRDMGRQGKDDAHVRFAPLSSVVEEAADPHSDRGKRIVVRVDGVPFGEETVSDQPEISRQPEIVHGLRNLVQNAVDFAKDNVWIDISWDDHAVRINVGDDGQGYPADMIQRIGDPFVRRRFSRDQSRPGYEGMGLGLFIAKTLLERTGATLTFANGSGQISEAVPVELARPSGAIVEVLWKREKVAVDRKRTRGALGTNPRNPTN